MFHISYSQEARTGRSVSPGKSHLIITHEPFGVLSGQQIWVDLVADLQWGLIQERTSHLAMTGEQIGEEKVCATREYAIKE